MTVITLTTQTTPHGIDLTFADGTKAGTILTSLPVGGGVKYRFYAPDGARGFRARASLKSAEYDALAYWEEQAELAA
jgi:hypothetical protein